MPRKEDFTREKNLDFPKRQNLFPKRKNYFLREKSLAERKDWIFREEKSDFPRQRKSIFQEREKIPREKRLDFPTEKLLFRDRAEENNRNKKKQGPDLIQARQCTREDVAKGRRLPIMSNDNTYICDIMLNCKINSINLNNKQKFKV